MPNRVKAVTILVIIFIFGVNLFNVWRKIEEGKKRLVSVEFEVDQTKKRKEELEKEIAQKQSLEFLEREARDRLNLIKPGERIVILPPKESSELGTQNSEPDSGRSIGTPNWLRWWRLFFE